MTNVHIARKKGTVWKNVCVTLKGLGRKEEKRHTDRWWIKRPLFHLSEPNDFPIEPLCAADRRRSSFCQSATWILPCLSAFLIGHKGWVITDVFWWPEQIKGTTSKAQLKWLVYAKVEPFLYSELFQVFKKALRNLYHLKQSTEVLLSG